MLSEYKLHIVIIMIAFAIICIVSGIIFAVRGNTMLDKTIYSLLSRELAVGYTICKYIRSKSLIDQGGEWLVSLDKNLNSIKLRNTTFKLADKSDLDYFVMNLKQKDLARSDLRGYKLYRAALKMGEDTICGANECNIYLLHSQDSRDMYIGIYKN